MMIKNNKRSQAELITSVLLILIGIAAVVLVSVFVINIVRTNLKGTECFATTGQIEIDTTGGYSYFNSTSTPVEMYLSIKRGAKDFNLSGISVVFGTERLSKSLKLIAGETNTNVFYYTSRNTWNNSNLILPGAGESVYYKIIVGNLGVSSVSKVSIAPILSQGTSCDKTEEKEIPLQ